MSENNRLADAVAPLRRWSRLGVAVSGGSDSLALLRLLHDLDGPKLRAVTVDHGLREGACAEADRVGDICAGLGISHDRLAWTGWDGTGNLQDQARRARYRLMAEWGAGHGLEAIALGHTLDDQAETFLMRLARRAGVDGLAQMAAEFSRGGMVFLRPLLGGRRAELRGYLDGVGQGWIDDPSNMEARFDRVRARAVLEVLQPLGIEAEVLASVAANMATARAALEACAAEAARRIVRLEAGDLVFDRLELLDAPTEIFRRLMVGALRFVARGEYAPRSAPVMALQDSVAAEENATLRGCRILVQGNTVRVTRELNAVQDILSPTTVMWDGRWRFHGPHAPDLKLRALGASGLTLCADWRATGLPRESLMATPAVWRADTLISAPIAGFSAGWTAELTQSCDEFVNSFKSH